MMEKRFTISQGEIKNCKLFSEKSSKSQREYRSGGLYKRSSSEIYSDTLRGKIAEVITKKFFEQDFFKFKGIKLDFGVYPRGIWDKSDINLGKSSISIKSSKSFAKWLLIEKKDIGRGDNYDFYIIVLVDNFFNHGEVKGFASKEEVINVGGNTMLLKQREFIPGTATKLDADNHGIRIDNL